MADHFGNIPIQKPQSPSGEKPIVPQKATRSKKKPPSRPPVKRKGKIAYWMLSLLSILLAYYTFGVLAVPYYLSELLPLQLKEKTGYTLEVDNIAFNPFTFQLTSGQLNIVSQDNLSTISYKSLVANIATVPLLRFNLVSNSTEVKGLDILLIREDDKTYNIEKLFPRAIRENGSEIIEFSDLPFFFSLNNISIEDSRIEFKDNPAGKVHRIEDIQLNLPTFSNIPFEADRYIQPYFKAIINGSPFELTGKTSAGYGLVDSAPTELSCEVTALNLQSYGAYLPFNLPFIIEKGNASGTIDLSFDPSRAPSQRLSINLNLKLSDLQLRNQSDSVTIHSASSELVGSFQPTNNNLTLNKVIVHSPSIYSAEKNFPSTDKVNTTKSKNPDEISNVNVNPFSYKIQSLFLLDGKLEIDGKYKGKSDFWEKLQLDVKNYKNSEYLKKYTSKTDGTFALTSQKRDSQATLSYKGDFKDPNNLSGSFILDKAKSGTIFGLMLGEDAPKSSGIGTLEATLNLHQGPGQTTWTTSFVEGKATIEKFKLQPQSKPLLQTPLLQLKGIFKTAESTQIRSVVVKKGRVQLTRDSRGFLPQPIKTLFSDKLTFHAINFQGELIFISSVAKKPQLTISNLTASATHLDQKENTIENISFNATLSPSGTIKGRGTTTISPFSAKLATEFENIEAQKILSLFPGSSTRQILELPNGSLEGEGVITLPKKSFIGNIQLKNGWLEKDSRKFLSWNNLSFSKLQYINNPFSFSAEEVVFNHPKAALHFTPAGDYHLLAIAHHLRSYLPTTKEKDSKVSSISIANASLSDGEIRVFDQRISPAWTGNITQFSGSIENINSPRTAAHSVIRGEGLLNGSPLKLGGNISLFHPAENSHLEFSLTDMPTGAFAEQLKAGSDLDPSSGMFSLKSALQIQGSTIHAPGQITFINLKPVSVKHDAALPLGLLTQEGDKIDLPFSFSSTIKNNRSLVDDILAQLQKTIVKGTVSPLLLTKTDFSDLSDIEHIAFTPGEFVLTDIGKKYMKRFYELLQSHPYVGIVLSGGVNTDIDRSALEEKLKKQENKRIEQENKILFEKYLAAKEAYESQAIQRQKQPQKEQISEMNIPKEVMKGFVPLQPANIVIDNAMLLDLAQKRIKVVEQFLSPVNSLLFKRIFVEHPESTDQFNPGQNTGVKVRLRAVEK